MSSEEPSGHIDLACLRRSADGDEAFLHELITMIHADIEVRRQKLEESLAAEDMPSVKRFAHTLKGHALHVGATTLVDLARSIESAAMDENPVLCRLNVDALTLECAAVQRELQNVLQGRGTDPDGI